jgi:hypothetical protein
MLQEKSLVSRLMQVHLFLTILIHNPRYRYRRHDLQQIRCKSFEQPTNTLALDRLVEYIRDPRIRPRMQYRALTL